MMKLWVMFYAALAVAGMVLKWGHSTIETFLIMATIFFVGSQLSDQIKKIGQP
jgi:hypothetical protein